MLLFGIIISGFVFYAFIQVSNATREGARAGSVYRITQTGSGLTLEETVQQAIYDPGDGISSLGDLDTRSSSFDATSDVAVSVADIDGDSTFSPGDQLTVRVTYHYRLPVLFTLLPMFQQPMVVVRTVTMEVQ